MPGEGEVPAHDREVRVALFSFNPRATFGLGKGFQVAVEVPLALKHRRYTYTLDDEPFAPPGAVPEELRFGVGDVRLRGSLYGSPIGVPQLILGVGVGAALPTGKTGAHPRDLQFGGGTVDPTLDLSLVARTDPVGFLASGSGRFPLYENKKGYRGSIAIEGAVGTMLQPAAPADGLILTFLVHATHLEPERWNGSPWVNSGKDALGLSLGAAYRVNPSFVVHGQVRANVVERRRGEQFGQPVVATLGVTGHIDVKKR